MADLAAAVPSLVSSVLTVLLSLLRGARLFAWAGALALVGCTQSALIQGRIDGLKQVAEQARANGAYRCAPQELALATAQLDFAQVELDQGDQDRAGEHLTLAEPNARAALRLSPRAECSGEPKPGDRDGDGIADPNDKCPEIAEDRDGVEDEDGCFEDQDSDGDGVGDATDLCITEPEDADGYLDVDGCPDPDNDGDRLADAADKCVDQPEDHDTFADEDGCPDLDNDADSILDVDDSCPNEAGTPTERGCPSRYKDVIVTNDKVVITQQVFFETNKTKIRELSFGLLNTVAQVLRDFPDMRVEVQGHTDDRGADGPNLKLSQGRAESVREYLIGQGIEPYRMTARGYGETKPIESNKTPSGRAANRRVEFIRTDDAAQRQSSGAATSSGPAPTPPATTTAPAPP